MSGSHLAGVVSEVQVLSVDYRKVADQLADLIGSEKVTDEVVDRMAYSRDWSVRPSDEAVLPDLIVRPTSREDVVKVVQVASRLKVPVVTAGGLTGMAGGAVASSGGILLDTNGLNKVLEIDEANLTVTVQAGITINKLNEELRRHRLWFPHDPESKIVSTVGAAIACRSDSTFGIKYGKIEQALVDAVVVTGSGELIRVGHRKTLISSSGYQLHWLLLGSEGTLGIIVEATLRVFPLPEERALEMFAFPSLNVAAKAINRMVQAGLSIESANIMCSNRFYFYTHDYRVKYGRDAEVPPDTRGVLCISFAGDREVVDRSREYSAKICGELSGSRIGEREIVEAWWTSKHRQDFEPFKQAWPDSQRTERFGAADVSIPQGFLDDAFLKYQELAAKNGMRVLGMNVYVQSPYAVHTSVSFAVYVDDRDRGMVERFYGYVRDMALYAVSIGGSMTSYQGDGEKFGDFSRLEHGDAFEYMRRIKEVFDPAGVLNPGKKFAPSKWIRPEGTATKVPDS
jgi:glycolate oxidase